MRVGIAMGYRSGRLEGTEQSLTKGEAVTLLSRYQPSRALFVNLILE